MPLRDVEAQLKFALEDYLRLLPSLISEEELFRRMHAMMLLALLREDAARGR